MKRVKIVAVLVGLLVLLSLASCDYIAPDIEKSKTEKAQFEQLKIQNDLLREQNKQLTRIADALEQFAKEK